LFFDMSWVKGHKKWLLEMEDFAKQRRKYLRKAAKMNKPETKEPTEEEIRKRMEESELSYYTAREQLREERYGKPPNGFTDWGTYWKTY